MRSVVVVLPASMCAMIPMLRVLASWAWVPAMSLLLLLASTCGMSVRGCRGSPGSPARAGAAGPALPAVVREGLVGLGHLVGVLAALDRRTQTVARVEQLVHQTLGHRLLPAGAAVLDQPAQAQGGAARGAHLDRHLVGRTTDAAAADLEGRLDVVQRTLERDDRVGVGLRPGALEGAVDDRLGDRALAVDQHLVDQLGDQRRLVDRVGDERTTGSGTLAGHVSSSPSSRRTGCEPACGCGRPGCPASRG